ncbi:MAG TPA: hypothetical protein VHU23_14290 [Rhizomicrobium sp.]|jgi:phosphoserine phosphatase|nr:hypothetical protein [Rhizomicrobium sp.]
MPQTPLRRVAALLDPTAPNKAVAMLTGAPKQTARTWLRGTRHPPLHALEAVQRAALQRAREILAITGNGGELAEEVARRAHKQI